MKTITLTRGYSVVVDNEDFEYLSQFNWRVLKNKRARTQYAVRSFPGRRGSSILMHRELTGAGKRDLVDHKNRNGLDCRKGNLRFASFSQNAANSPLSCDNKSGFRGVSWNEERGKWLAQIGVGNKNTNLGRYDSVEEAARAYDKAAMVAHGDFAVLNFPNGTTKKVK